MSHSPSIPAGLPIVGSGNSTAPARNSAPAQPRPAAEAKPVQLFVNPSYRFDPTVGLVVIEFHNDTGKVENSIPSERQLNAYRTHQEPTPGDQPAELPRNAETHPGNAKTSAG